MDVTLAWDPNTEENLAGYRIYAREEGESYSYSQPEWEGTDTQCTVQGFDEYESYYFVVRALDTEGNESGDSNEVYLSADNTGNPSNGALDDTTSNNDASGGGGGGGGCFINAILSD